MKTITGKRPAYVVRRIGLPVPPVPAAPPSKNLIQQLRQYINRQAAGENRFKWVGMAMTLQAVIITPFVGVMLSLTGSWMPLWYAATAAMYATFIPVLAGLKTKTVMTVFFSNLAVNAAIIVTAVVYSMIS